MTSGAGSADEAVVEIHGISSGGAGVGRLPSGRVVFVHRTVPGEQVRVRIRESKRSWARADLIQVLAPAAERRAAPCPYYERCGGCTLEHLSYDAQRAAKRSMVAEALRRIGDTEPPDFDVVGAPEEFRYRNRVSFTLRRLPSGRVVAGFHELDRPDRILDMDGDCMLPEPAVATAWSALRRQWGERAGRLPAGRELRLTLRGTAAGRVVLLIEGGHSGRCDELLERVPALSAVWHAADQASPPVLVAGEPAVPEEWGDRMLEVGGRTFLQVNRQVAPLLEAQVLEYAGDVSGLCVVDAYCGVGAHAIGLARRGAGDVLGIELDQSAVEQARAAAPAGVRIEAGDVAELLPDHLPADVVVLNPPRAGVDERVTSALAARPPRRLVYVSCDPATLARDAARLAPLRLRALRCFDLFPQTAHVETVALFEP